MRNFILHFKTDVHPQNTYFYFFSFRYETFIRGSEVICGYEQETLLGLAQRSFQQVRANYHYILAILICVLSDNRLHVEVCFNIQSASTLYVLHR